VEFYEKVHATAAPTPEKDASPSSDDVEKKS